MGAGIDLETRRPVHGGRGLSRSAVSEVSCVQDRNKATDVHERHVNAPGMANVHCTIQYTATHRVRSPFTSECATDVAGDDGDFASMLTLREDTPALDVFGVLSCCTPSGAGGIGTVGGGVVGGSWFGDMPVARMHDTPRSTGGRTLGVGLFSWFWACSTRRSTSCQCFSAVITRFGLMFEGGRGRTFSAPERRQRDLAAL